MPQIVFTRRQLGGSLAAAVAVAIAGCADDSEPSVDGSHDDSDGETHDDSDGETHDDSDGETHDDSDSETHNETQQDDSHDGEAHNEPHHDADHENGALVSQVALLDHDDRTDDRVLATYHGHWHGGLPSIEVGSYLGVTADIEAEDGTEITIGDDEQYRLTASIEDESILRAEPHDDHLDLFAESTGETTLMIQLLDNQEVAWESSDALAVTVSEND